MTTKTTTMTGRHVGTMRTLGSACRAAAAMKAGRQPAPRDLERLGIRPSAFAEINLA